MTISNHTLMKIASFGGIATVTMGLLFRGKIDGNIKETPYYKEALKTVRHHRAAVHLLGEPIKDRTINISDQLNNFTKENEAQYEVPVKGPRQKGTIYFWAFKTKEDQWKVTRIELGLDKEPDKRLVVKSEPLEAS